jgi:hypothetical protein
MTEIPISSLGTNRYLCSDSQEIQMKRIKIFRHNRVSMALRASPSNSSPRSTRSRGGRCNWFPQVSQYYFLLLPPLLLGDIHRISKVEDINNSK